MSNVSPLIGVLIGIGLGLGCAGKKPKPDEWYDACCTTCTEIGCEDCSASKGACRDSNAAECMVHDDTIMCRPKPQERH